MPAAQGTICRVQTARDGTPTQGWCYKVQYSSCYFSVTSIQGECVPAGWRPRPVDGEWGHWNHWSECTKTCGIGVAFQSRQCDAPRPVHGGKYCLGVRRRYRTCNTEVSDVLSLRNVQVQIEGVLKTPVAISRRTMRKIQQFAISKSLLQLGTLYKRQTDVTVCAGLQAQESPMVFRAGTTCD